MLALALAWGGLGAQTAPTLAPQLSIVGGLAGVTQYTQFEAPFWQGLSALTHGQASAEIVPFNKAGIRSHEVMRLIQLGVVPFGTALMPGVLGFDPELAAMDLAGLNPDMASLRRSVAAFRPHLEAVMRERHGIEVLAIYTYPAQVTFCKQAFGAWSDLSGRRVRISNTTQSDLIRPFGAVPVQTEFADLVDHMRQGRVDCAITAAMSGHAIGLHQVATHLHSSAITWGLSLFAANRAAWNALPPKVRTVLQTELPKLERAIWADAERQTEEGLACNAGRSGCSLGSGGRMQEVPATVADVKQLREAFRQQVLPAWVQRCGNDCVAVWNRLLAPVSGVRAQPQAPAPAR